MGYYLVWALQGRQKLLKIESGPGSGATRLGGLCKGWLATGCGFLRGDGISCWSQDGRLGWPRVFTMTGR